MSKANPSAASFDSLLLFRGNVNKRARVVFVSTASLMRECRQAQHRLAALSLSHSLGAHLSQPLNCRVPFLSVHFFFVKCSCVNLITHAHDITVEHSGRRVRVVHVAAGGGSREHMHYLILAAPRAVPLAVLSEGVQIGNLAVHANAHLLSLCEST